jgi:adenylate cyclase
MGLKEDIVKKVKEIMDTEFVIEEVTSVPDITNSKLTFGNKGLKFDATVLFIDVRGSTKILNNHNKRTVAKIHMAYFHTVIKIATDLGGEVRSFNGDSMLVFFLGNSKEILTDAVIAAMKMKYMITNADNGINNYLKKYSTIDFGIGLDYGTILSTKIGVGGDSNTKDLIWIGNSVNKAVKLSDDAGGTTQISISEIVYDNLEDRGKLSNGVNMWTKSSFIYNDKTENYYYTSYYWIL